MNRQLFSFLLVLFNIAFAKANLQQEDSTLLIKRKVYSATRVATSPVIDGKPFEAFWNKIPVAKNFVMREPRNGEPERDTHKTKVKIAYDDNALYVAGYMYDNEPERILRQFSQRDNVFVQADLFEFHINTYNNQINQTRFFATSGNALGDAIVEGDRQDFSFNVVFLSESTIDENGWYVEMEIPYRTLRFPENEVQDWSFQVVRRIRHLNEDYSYNFIDITTGNQTQYDALLTGVENIDPPLRLNLYPFSQVVYNVFDGEEELTFSAGMDLKYGISDAFTLDATLIPDFGQVAFDRVELNLGPFEQTFGENRAFFIEGADLFSKGDIFFSRRIGQTPTGAGRIETLDNEDIIDNPSTANLLNALKFTGRTDGGLGIGVLNAITERTEATIRNSESGATRNVLTEPLTNYNMLVLDQQYGNNSSIALSNASTLRNGSFTDANVTALELNHNNKKASDNYRGLLQMSNRFTPDGTETGYAGEAQWRRTTGKWRPRLGAFWVGDSYNPNDLGRQFQTNYLTLASDLSYLQQTQQGIFNYYEIELRVRHRRALTPSFHTGSDITLNPFFATVERFSFGGDFQYNTEQKDQFESRIPGQVVRYAPSYYMGGFISSDYRKKFAIDARAGYFSRIDDPETSYDYRLSPRYRFSDEFLLVYTYQWRKNNNRLSYVTRTDDGSNSILSLRNTHTVENRISGTYNFNNRHALSLSFRNNWSRANFSREFEELTNDGTTTESDFALQDDENPDANFNVWNLDFSYRWRFAPGSEATFLYRNAANNFDKQGQISYVDSVSNLFDNPIRHNFSLRITYFLDVNQARSWFSSNS
ncbi:hydrolase [Nonlabens spongiae]|uniref:Hydrolase n=1 Tax=Nonlabens spongiae TaxID=331648 RepID=A0A1W6MNC0_9FLAO|nr:DUF5916 domain-containing protein [Nonlabens spongiae]ARN79062.1 hydrolase [Nonlabens spongiae]